MGGCLLLMQCGMREPQSTDMGKYRGQRSIVCSDNAWAVHLSPLDLLGETHAKTKYHRCQYEKNSVGSVSCGMT